MKASIESVLNQSFRDIELIVVDDASPEDVEGLVRSIIDPRLRYVRRPTNGGAAAARNTGLAAAGGAFVAFQDSDDLWLPQKLERQMKLLGVLPPQVGAVVGTKILYSRDDTSAFDVGKVVLAPDPAKALTLDGDQIGHLLDENRISVQNALFRRECHPGSEWFDPCAKANEDWEFAVRLARRTKIFEHPEPVVLAFTSTDSISRSSRRQQIGVIRLLKKNKAILPGYRKQYGSMLFYLGRWLGAHGKKRSGRRFMMAGLIAHPLLVCGIAGGKLRRSLASPRTPISAQRRPQPADHATHGSFSAIQHPGDTI